MVETVRDWITNNDDAFFVEAFFPTLAHHRNFTVTGVEKSFGKFIRSRPCFDRSEVERLKENADGFLFHPVKVRNGVWRHC